MSDQRTKGNLPSPSHGLSFQGQPPHQVGRSGRFTDEDTEACEEKGLGQDHLVNNNNSCSCRRLKFKMFFLHYHTFKSCFLISNARRAYYKNSNITEIVHGECE